MTGGVSSVINKWRPFHRYIYIKRHKKLSYLSAQMPTVDGFALPFLSFQLFNCIHFFHYEEINDDDDDLFQICFKGLSRRHNQFCHILLQSV